MHRVRVLSAIKLSNGAKILARCKPHLLDLLLPIGRGRDRLATALTFLWVVRSATLLPPLRKSLLLLIYSGIIATTGFSRGCTGLHNAYLYIFKYIYLQIST